MAQKVKNIKLYKNDLPVNIKFKGSIAIDTETMGLNINNDRLCLIQISDEAGNSYIIQFLKNCYDAPNLKKLLTDKKISISGVPKLTDTFFFLELLSSFGVDIEGLNNFRNTKEFILNAKKINNDIISVNLGKISHYWKDIPLTREVNTLNMPIKLENFSSLFF